MTPVADRGWNPLAGLDAEALRPVQGEAAGVAGLGVGPDGRLLNDVAAAIAVSTADVELTGELRYPWPPAIQAESDRLSARWFELLGVVRDTPATSLAGIAAKARLFVHFSSEIEDDFTPARGANAGYRLLASLLADVVALAAGRAAQV